MIIDTLHELNPAKANTEVKSNKAPEDEQEASQIDSVYTTVPKNVGASEVQDSYVDLSAPQRSREEISNEYVQTLNLAS